MNAPVSDVRLLPDAEIVARSDGRLHPHLTILIEDDPEGAAGIRFCVADFSGEPHSRVAASLDYLRHLRGLAIDMADGAPLRPQDGDAIIFQADDNAHDVPSVSWERRRRWSSVALVPDIYYYDQRGYSHFLPALPAWKERSERFIWRGSSTGRPWFSADELDELPRYRFCRLAQQFGHADVAMTMVAQARTREDEERMTARLLGEQLLRPFMAMEDMGAAGRFIFDIDGNANSWNFMAKLRLGSCVLKVGSDWEQWFVDRLEPWRHYVPIDADLTDLHEKMAWCLDHPKHAECIAEEGRSFALAMQFEVEMRSAARTAFAGFTRRSA